ncbi:Copine [Arabidopsis thaliana x Arabidopsis arenosa]|uniref:Copine n=1 Tax=Arabidopsis thaliana x Arabidopsis arenosa TaxID=1240361 RepID=A0A8T2C3U3_9BRAS|nr:Copine [Arabidopsis thaliana x Arabidopsis arenosa]
MQDTPLVIECFDFKTSGNHELIGMTEKYVVELERLCLQKEVANFVYPTRSHGGNKYSFLDYISSGFELNFMVAVDFTASNGVPRRPSSLHHIDPSGRVLNSYQQRFPAWGFGGKTSDDYVSHAFNLNGASHTETVVGVKESWQLMLVLFVVITLAGPTLFSHVVEKAAHLARLSLSRNSPKYFVLLIITDGVLKDMEGTRDALVRASTLPLSVVIVGVGSRDFTQIQQLLDVQATREIVQFVHMKETNGGVSVVQPLLDELPGQFLSYVRSRKINPAGITILLINLSKQTKFTVGVCNGVKVVLQADIMKRKSFLETIETKVSRAGNKALDGYLNREEYHLSPKDGDLRSKIMLLNGNPLAPTVTGDIPNLEPVRHGVLPTFDAPACS